MVISGRIIDGIKKTAIQGATITVLTDLGQETALHTVSNNIGYFIITSDQITIQNKVEFSHPEYYTKQLPVNGAYSFGFVDLIEKPAVDIPAVDPGKNPGGGSSWWWVFGIGALLLLFAKKKKK